MTGCGVWVGTTYHEHQCEGLITEVTELSDCTIPHVHSLVSLPMSPVMPLPCAFLTLITPHSPLVPPALQVSVQSHPLLCPAGEHAALRAQGSFGGAIPALPIGAGVRIIPALPLVLGVESSLPFR